MTLRDMITLKIGRYKIRPFGIAWWIVSLAMGALVYAGIVLSFSWAFLL